MQLQFILFISTTCVIASVLSATTLHPQGFSARSLETDDDEYESQAQTHLAYRQRAYDYSQEEEQEEAPRQVYQSRNNVAKQSNSYQKNNKNVKTSIEEETEEEEEPDRLSLLLEKSQFNCNSKTTGYYADESLSCEVFHYCQENQRHSWICPEGFTFHQLHLICMPPSNENICDQSSKYHIVNDYLYKPINLQEHQTKPNVTLRYSDRYYPESFYEHERYEDEEAEARQQVHHHQRQPLQVGFNTQQIQRPQNLQQQQQQQRHETRPTFAYRKSSSQQPSQQHLQQQQPSIPPQISQHQHATTPQSTQSPYRFFTQAPILQQHSPQQVYRSPEEINISLQQRRPQLFIATSTPRYFEDEFLYERRK